MGSSTPGKPSDPPEGESPLPSEWIDGEHWLLEDDSIDLMDDEAEVELADLDIEASEADHQVGSDFPILEDDEDTDATDLPKFGDDEDEADPLLDLNLVEEEEELETNFLDDAGQSVVILPWSTSVHIEHLNRDLPAHLNPTKAQSTLFVASPTQTAPIHTQITLGELSLTVELQVELATKERVELGRDALVGRVLVSS